MHSCNKIYCTCKLFRFVTFAKKLTGTPARFIYHDLRACVILLFCRVTVLDLVNYSVFYSSPHHVLEIICFRQVGIWFLMNLYRADGMKMIESHAKRIDLILCCVLIIDCRGLLYLFLNIHSVLHTANGLGRSTHGGPMTLAPFKICQFCCRSFQNLMMSPPLIGIK